MESSSTGQQDPPPRPTSSASTSSSNISKMCTTGTRRRFRRNRGGSESQFPGKLYDLLEYAASSGLQSVISWVRNGTALMVHDPDKLVKILPEFFGQTKYRSFRRQLNMWHYHRIMEGPHRGAFMHPCFIRGNKQLINYMSRSAYASELSLAVAETPASPVDFSLSSMAQSYEDYMLRNKIQHHSGNYAPVPIPQNPTLLPAILPFHGASSKTKGTLYSVAPSPSSLDPHLGSRNEGNTLHSLKQDWADGRLRFEPSAITLTESPVVMSINKFSGMFIGNICDGDPISFAGRNFHFVDCGSPQKEHTPYSSSASFDWKGHKKSPHTEISSPTYREEHVEMAAMNAFSDDPPMIVSDNLLEPLSAEIFDTIFAPSSENEATLSK